MHEKRFSMKIRYKEQQPYEEQKVWGELNWLKIKKIPLNFPRTWTSKSPDRIIMPQVKLSFLFHISVYVFRRKNISNTLTEQKWKLKRIMALRQVKNFTRLLHISSSTNFWATERNWGSDAKWLLIYRLCSGIYLHLMLSPMEVSVTDLCFEDVNFICRPSQDTWHDMYLEETNKLSFKLAFG